MYTRTNYYAYYIVLKVEHRLRGDDGVPVDVAPALRTAIIVLSLMLLLLLLLVLLVMLLR